MLAFDPSNLGLMNVNGVPTPPLITSVNNTTFVAGADNNFAVTATGFPTPGYSVQGTLPPGVQFFGMTGVLTGKPSAGSAGGWPLVFTATNGVMPNATQNFALVIARPPCTLDIDGNGNVDALSDGLMLIRAMFGLTGTPVTSNAVGQGAARTTWAQIRDYLNGTCGANFAQ
jgi:hypothetical protein